MKYYSTKLATNFSEEEIKGWKTKLMYFLLFFIPKANPDNEPLYPKVKKWLIEVDDENMPVREIALDERGEFLFRSPDDRNYGFWTDLSGPLDLEEITLIEQTEFEKQWGNDRNKQ